MKLTKGIIKADIITAKQAIAYFDEKHESLGACPQLTHDS